MPPSSLRAAPAGPRLRPCGAYVAYALAQRLAGREFRCEVLELDQYDRRVARCEVEEEGLSQWLVTSGLGIGVPALHDRFIEEEDAARAAGLVCGRRTSSRRASIAPSDGRSPHRRRAPQGCIDQRKHQSRRPADLRHAVGLAVVTTEPG
jgi:hypothetical protein